MTRQFRQFLLPFLLAVLLGWQGFAVAEHKASYQHALNTDHHCALCAMSAPAIASTDVVAPVVVALGYQSSDYLVQSPQKAQPDANARAPPFFSSI
ncbi:hypothetical protein [Enterovibrio sp. 27052020O]|uniref:hypothetical protein n=1 Tax=Enterovibrio sp. 27052020O TaxID=3241166 RepID=UPI003890AFCA